MCRKSSEEILRQDRLPPAIEDQACSNPPCPEKGLWSLQARGLKYHWLLVTVPSASSQTSWFVKAASLLAWEESSTTSLTRLWTEKREGTILPVGKTLMEPLEKQF